MEAWRRHLLEEAAEILDGIVSEVDNWAVDHAGVPPRIAERRPVDGLLPLEEAGMPEIVQVEEAEERSAGLFGSPDARGDTFSR